MYKQVININTLITEYKISEVRIVNNKSKATQRNEAAGVHIKRHQSCNLAFDMRRKNIYDCLQTLRPGCSPH